MVGVTGVSASLPFDLRALQVFLAVCDAGGMAIAARRLGITQPSVSQTIAEIEARTGTKLFDRTVRPIDLTPVGEVLRQQASTLLAEAHEIAPMLRRVGRGRLPFLRVGLVDSLSRTLTAPIARFLADVADQSSLLSGLTAFHTAALSTRQLDIVLGAEGGVADSEGLERHALWEEPYVLLCRSDVTPPKTVEALQDLVEASPLIRYSARSLTGMEIERHLRRLRLDPPRHQEFDTPHGVTAAVAAGLGWAITTPLCVKEGAINDAGLLCRALPGPALVRHLVLVARQREFGTVPRQLASLCRAVLGETVPIGEP